MKRMLITGILAVLAGSISLFAQEMNNAHVLTALWKQYDQAQKADLPQKEAEVLARIKEEAVQRHLPVDFYDAATAYVSTVLRRDWKQRDALQEQLEKEVEAFHDPLVTFLWMAEWKHESTDKLWAYVQARPDSLTGCNRALHRGTEGILGGSLKPFIRSDREYALWYLYTRRYSDGEEITQALETEVAGVYPNAAILEFVKLGRRNWKESEEEQQAYEALAAQYAGKAFSIYPRAEVQRIRFSRLGEEKADGKAYEALYQDVAALEKERKACTGEAKTLVAGCNYLQSLMETLTGRDLEIQYRDSRAFVLFRNLKTATVTLREDKKILRTWKVENSAQSFYVLDTVKLDLPKLPDGEYTLEARNGKVSASEVYKQFTLSVATRRDSRGVTVYVTDYETGVPLRSVTLHLKKSGTEVAASTLRLDGFTPLPTALTKHMKGSRASWEVVAQSGDRKSRSIYLDRPYSSRDNYPDQVRCNIYKDRGAYNPGDTLQFKAIVYQGDPAKGLQVVKDRPVKMILRDSEDNVLETLQLKTNDWGSVSGRFVLPTGLRNGRFELEAEGLGYDWFRVDEFVLPTFDLQFFETDRLYLVGDEVPVSGRLISYSGHNLSGARVRVKVSYYGHEVLDQEAVLADDNTFQVLFPTPETAFYRAEVTVTDAGGETRSFSTGLFVGSDLSVKASVFDAADADPVVADGRYGEKYVVTQPTLKLALQALDGGSTQVPLPVEYELLDAAGKAVATGESASGEAFTLNLPAAGAYEVKTRVSARNARGETVTGGKSFRVFYVPEDARELCPELTRLFVSGPGKVAPKGSIVTRLGSTEGDIWGVATLYGENRKVLVHDTFHVNNGAMDALTFTYKDTYPDAVRLQVFYFLHGKSVTYNREYRRAQDNYSLPLSFTRFQDKAYPGTQYSFSLKTAPGAEVLAAAWDKSLDNIQPNEWELVNLWDYSVENVGISSACGVVGADYHHGPFYARGARFKSVGMANVEMADEATPFQLVEQKPAFGGSPEPVDIREKFSSALTFQPHLRPAADGTLTFSFTTSDKLSTYYVGVYAHDQKMHNALLEEEMVVSLPVIVSILEPRYLYVGDVYNAAVTLSSVADEDVSGTLSLQVGDTVQQADVTVPAGKTVTRYFPVTVTSEGNTSEVAKKRADASSEVSPSAVTLTAAFRSAGFSDGVRVHVPVLEATQELTEAHSAVLLAGMDREALLEQLRARFVNVPGSEATLRDITVLDMVKDAIPSHVEPRGNDVLALSEAWYMRLMAGRLTSEGNTLPSASLRDPVRANAPGRVSPSDDNDLLEKVLVCRNADGGFAWFEGMPSSPVITAVVLERMARLRDRGFEVPDMTATVKYLDKNQLGTVQPYWCGWLSDAQYMYVRAMYAPVPFTEEAVSAAQKKRFRELAKDVKGSILAKARRLLTLRNLLERDGGLALARAWGISLGTRSKLEASMKSNLASLVEYAVPHKDGGWYYPNAVMPWRGLLESEAYAHTLLCDLLTGGDTLPSASLRDPVRANAPGRVSPSVIADGIRLWLMLQKETQKWDASPEFVDAVTAILDGSEEVLQTRVLALSATYRAPIQAVKAAGNGFTVERKFFREGVEIKPGEEVKVGDRITVQYAIWNAENRSFVKLTAGREASLSPVNQLSGLISFRGYRNVKASATEYFFSTYPEEKTTVTEDFFVVRAGTFVAPVTVIESLYAPHYRANSAYREPLVSRIKL